MVKWRGGEVKRERGGEGECGEVKRERCRVVGPMKHTFQSAPIAAMC